MRNDLSFPAAVFISSRNAPSQQKAVSETCNDPARFQHYFFMGGGGVFVVVSVFKNFILKLGMAMSIFLTFLSKIVARVCNTEK